VKPTPEQHNTGSKGSKQQLKSQDNADRHDTTAKGNRKFNRSTSPGPDNTQEVINQMNYAESKGLGGVFCWSLDNDPQGILLKVMTQ
jgi:GH18 family chitinase